MSHRSIHRVLMALPCALFAAGANGCLTPTAAAPPPPPTPAADPEVVLLRGRVARLEKRIVEVDSKLALLVARADGGGSARSRPLRFDLPRGEQQPIDLAPALPPSIDIERTPPEDIPIEDAGDEAPVTIRLHGNIKPSEASDDDPLSALSSAADLYSWGQTRMKEGRHQEAIAAFEDVLGRFPTNDLADNALYWIGWCHQQKGDHRLAIAAWQKLPARFPRSAKVADGLFGMAQSHEALGEPAVAETLYDEVVSSYPKAEKLKEAKKALGRLRPR